MKEIYSAHLPDRFDKEKLTTILIDRYDKIRDKNERERNIEYEHTIKLCDDTPVTSKPRPVAYAFQCEIFKKLDEILERSIIKHSDSPHFSPITLGNKLDATIRLCCDFRKLNVKTIPKSFLIPKAENILENMNEADVVTVVDLKSAY